MSRHNHMVQRVFFGAFLLLAVFCTPAAAHIEKGSMPDPVAEMEYRILLEFEPDNLDIRNQLGMVFFRQNKIDEAAQEFNYVLEREPENFNAIDGLGLVSMKRADYQGAMNLFKKAITINPDDMLVYAHLGQALEQQGDFPGAAEAYRTGLSRETASGNGQPAANAEQRKVLLEALGNLQKKQGKNEEKNR